MPKVKLDNWAIVSKGDSHTAPRYHIARGLTWVKVCAAHLTETEREAQEHTATALRVLRRGTNGKANI